MKVYGPGSLRPGQPSKKVSSSGGGSEFLKHMQETGGGEDAAPVSGASGAFGINPLMALQEVDDALTGKRQARQRADSILDLLEDLRLGLLAGTFPREKLADLVRMVQSRRANVDDPRLIEILDEIDLRAQVEIAKLMPPA